jgi:hypothetical protein
MKAYQDKESGLWKWGTRGQPLYKSKGEAERAGMDILTEKLRYLRDKLNGTMANHGK